MAGVNRGWGPIRCTWGNNKPDRTKTQQKIIQLHGYRSRPISRNLAEISIAYVIGKREAASSSGHDSVSGRVSKMAKNYHRRQAQGARATATKLEARHVEEQWRGDRD